MQMIGCVPVPSDALYFIAENAKSFHDLSALGVVSKAFNEAANCVNLQERFINPLTQVLETNYKFKPNEVVQVIGSETTITEIGKLNRVSKRLRAADEVLEVDLPAKKSRLSNTNAPIQEITPAKYAEDVQAHYAKNGDYSNALRVRFLEAFTKAVKVNDIIQARLILGHPLVEKMSKRQKESYIRKIKIAAEKGHFTIVQDILASKVYASFKDAYPANPHSYFKVLNTELTRAACLALKHGHLELFKLLIRTERIVGLNHLFYYTAVRNLTGALENILNTNRGAVFNTYGENLLIRTLMTIAEQGYESTMRVILSSNLASQLPKFIFEIAIGAARSHNRPEVIRAIQEYKQQQQKIWRVI